MLKLSTDKRHRKNADRPDRSAQRTNGKTREYTLPQKLFAAELYLLSKQIRSAKFIQ